MSLPVKEFGVRLGDILKWEVHPAYCREGYLLHNQLDDGETPPAAVALEAVNPVGQPMRIVDGKFEFILAGDEDHATHLCLEQADINLDGDGTTVLQVAGLANRPAIVATKKLPAKDVAGGTLTWATIKAALTAIKFVESPTQTEEM